MWAIIAFFAVGTFGVALVFSLGLAALWALKSGLVRGFAENAFRARLAGSQLNSKRV
jgi:hypothetical protein